ncbi:MAG: fasciclin domain-containing protein [Luminiphilus sp.]|nr:fasciclin domain-containing protein [Luminiphilus sp.]
MNSNIRIISRALVASLLVFGAACSDSGDGVLYSDDLPTAPEASPAAPEPSAGNILEVATAAGNFPTLLAAVEAAGLVDALSDDGASLTVFAPTEEAFAALPEGALDALLADPDALSNVLTYHVLESEVSVSAALDLAPATVETLQGGNVAVTSRPDEYLYINMSKVVDYDIEASNGVIHVVDSVILPPDLTPSTLTIAEIAASDENFETLVAAASAGNLLGTMSDPDADITVFAPTDAAFEALGENAVSYLLDNPELLESTLLHHVLAAEVTSIDAIAAAGGTVTMANGEDASIGFGESGRTLTINSANITVTDIVASNGIIHVIDSVLGTEGLEFTEEDTGILGTWMLAPEAGSLGVGPTEFDVSWWNGDDGVIAARACFYDDEYVFSRDGTFANVLGAETWVETWQGATTDACAAPVAPHDASIPATFEYDEEAMTLTISGQGSYMGLPKAVNGAEIASPVDAPASILYNAYMQEDGSMLVTVEAGAGVWWNYKFIKTAEPTLDGYTLVWHDEFDGSELNADDWNYETGDGTEFGLPAGWGNDELQIYTANTENVSLGIDDDNSVLQITALEDGNGGYTSARITTEDKVSVRYGKIVARIKLPESQGIWPAFWMLGDNIDEVSWPGSGEIDVVELVGSAPDETFHTLHYVNGEQSYNFNGRHYELATKFSEDYHEFVVDWTPSSITWFVDGNQAHTVTITDDMMEFQRSFHLLLNVAVGGRLPGSPDETSAFPQTMYVDYVRVYEQDGFIPDPEPELDLNEETVGGISQGDADPNEAILSGFDAFIPDSFARFGAGGEPDWFSSTDAVDGAYSVRFAYPGGNWGGAWMELEDPVDLTAYSQSDLVFAIKMPEIVTGLEVKIEGLNPSDGSMFLENYTPTDLGDSWRQYRIPLADFVADGLQLDQIKIPFALWNPVAADGSFPEVDILFDAIHFE